jgi:serpin B
MLVLLAASLALAGCEDIGPNPTDSPATSGGPDSTGPTTTSGDWADEILLAKSDVSRLAPAASEADVQAAAGSLQAFGADLYGILAQGAGNGNLVFSPASIVTALAMTHAGAAGQTAADMAATLHFTLEGDALHQAFNSLDAKLESRSWEGKDSEGKDQGVLVRTANSLWGQKDLVFVPAFLDTLAANFGAGIRLCDFQTATEEAREAINWWVSEETNEKIPELIAEGVLSPDTRLVLVNAIYLDADWASQFNPEATYDGDFTTLSGQTVTTSMMTQQSWFPYAAGDGWQAVELPYQRDQLAMLLIVPDEGRFAEVEAGLATGLLDETVAALGEEVEVDLTMPKFEFRTQAALNDALKALGMGSAFDANLADFSGMTTQVKLFISAVIHEAFIAVDEKGTEAAAATAVVMEETMAPMPTEVITLTIDRPFLFALRDRATGAILFLGRVADPTAG